MYFTYRCIILVFHVLDPIHLSVIPTNEFYLVQMMQYTSDVLPCRPTSPDVVVELFEFDGDQVSCYGYVHSSKMFCSLLNNVHIS